MDPRNSRQNNNNNNNNNSTSHFIRNGEGSSSVRLRRRKDMIGVPASGGGVVAGQSGSGHNNPERINGTSSDFAGIKKRNRHSGDFYQWNYHHNHNNIVIPAAHNPNRFSMYENRVLLTAGGGELPDELRMETLDRKVEAENNSTEVWKIPVLTRPPLSGTGHRILDPHMKSNHRRSCDLSMAGNSNLIDDDVKTDVNRNVSGDKSRVNSRSAAKKYHKRVSFFPIKYSGYVEFMPRNFKNCLLG